jgi:hypothetical protein
VITAWIELNTTAVTLFILSFWVHFFCDFLFLGVTIDSERQDVVGKEASVYILENRRLSEE